MAIHMASLGQTQLPLLPNGKHVYTKNLYMNVHSSIIWVNKLWHIYIMKYYSAIKMNEVLIHGITWMDFKHIMLSLKSQTHNKPIHCMVPFISHVQNRDRLINRVDEWLPGAGEKGNGG